MDTIKIKNQKYNKMQNKQQQGGGITEIKPNEKPKIKKIIINYRSDYNKKIKL